MSARIANAVHQAERAVWAEGFRTLAIVREVHIDASTNFEAAEAIIVEALQGAVVGDWPRLPGKTR